MGEFLARRKQCAFDGEAMLECVPHVSVQKFTFLQYVGFVVQEIEQRADVKNEKLTFRKRSSKASMKFLSDVYRNRIPPKPFYPMGTIFIPWRPTQQDIDPAIGNADLEDKDTVAAVKSMIDSQIKRQNELGPKTREFLSLVLRDELPKCRRGAKLKANEDALKKHLMFMLTEHIGLDAYGGVTGSNIYASDIVERALRELGYKKNQAVTIRNKTKK